MRGIFVSIKPQGDIKRNKKNLRISIMGKKSKKYRKLKRTMKMNKKLESENKQRHQDKWF